MAIFPACLWGGGGGIFPPTYGAAGAPFFQSMARSKPLMPVMAPEPAIVSTTGQAAPQPRLVRRKCPSSRFSSCERRELTPIWSFLASWEEKTARTARLLPQNHKRIISVAAGSPKDRCRLFIGARVGPGYRWRGADPAHLHPDRSPAGFGGERVGSTKTAH